MNLNDANRHADGTKPGFKSPHEWCFVPPPCIGDETKYRDLLNSKWPALLCICREDGNIACINAEGAPPRYPVFFSNPRHLREAMCSMDLGSKEQVANITTVSWSLVAKCLRHSTAEPVEGVVVHLGDNKETLSTPKGEGQTHYAFIRTVDLLAAFPPDDTPWSPGFSSPPASPSFDP